MERPPPPPPQPPLPPPPPPPPLPPVVNIYPLSNYKFCTKEPKLERDESDADREARLKKNYTREGVMRRSVEAIIVAHARNTPHILVLETRKGLCKLPGGRLRREEDEIDGMRRKLTSTLGANSPARVPDWQISECIGVWWKPGFETEIYPYIPPHITKPKECTKLFLVSLPEKAYFEVPSNLKLLAVPLFELYSQSENYGCIISNTPAQLSIFEFNLIASRV